MKPDYWTRLARAARQAPPEAAGEPPYGFVSRVLATRPAPEEGAELASLAGLLRWAIIGCVVALILSLATNYGTLQEPVTDSQMIANDAVRTAMLP